MESLIINSDCNRPCGKRRKGFTLVELLVVIGIIALLISVLLPALSKARREANTVACLSNLRSIGQALTIYTSENGGYLPGAGLTTGAGLWQISAGGICVPANGVTITNIPGNAIQCEDWVGPLASCMGIPLPTTDGTARFVAYCNLPQFLCPEYVNAIWTPNLAAGSNVGAQQAFSYCSALGFLVGSWTTGHLTATHWPGNLVAPTPNSAASSSPYFTLPPNYVPKMTKLGKSSTKIFCADGGRLTFSYNSQAFITEYTLTADPANTDQNGTMFADLGPFSGDSHAWDRSCIPGNAGSPPTTDLRPLAYRHGARSGFQKDGSYLLNAVFYDGHAETLDGPDSSNPALWLPSGSMITASTGVGFPTVLGTTAIYVDVAKRYGLLGVSATKPWIVP